MSAPLTTADELVFSYMKDGASRDMNVNGSVTPVEFDYVAPEDIYLSRVLFMIQDGGILPSKFGGEAELTNGLDVEILTAGEAQVIDFCDGFPIKTHKQFGMLAGSDVSEDDASGDDVVLIRWTLEKAGAPVKLESGQIFRVTVNDDLTGLVKFYAMVQGVKLWYTT